jgi:DNA-binding CsgD family transcriptional regulator
MAAANAELTFAEDLEKKLSELSDARSYRDSFGFRYSRALQYVAASNLAAAESMLKSMPPTSLSASERAVRDALVAVLDLLRDNRTAASRSLERGLLADASHDYYARTEISRAHALRGLAFWALDRPAQARKAFAFEREDLPKRDLILVEAFNAVSQLPHPLANSNDVQTICSTLERADFSSYAILLRALVARDANDVELSAAEIETLRIFDRVGGSAADVAEALGKSKYTVQNQIQSAIRKLGCSGRAEALAYARKRGWLDTTS